jgi:uncharacterized protein YndB with AHSA1/START domain
MDHANDGDRYGTVLREPDGRVSVRFERRLPHAVDRVWAALTEADRLNAWMPGVQFERRQGGSYQIWFGGDCEGPSHVSGQVEVWSPPSVLQLGTIRWELRPTPKGCQLVFSDVLVFQEDRSDTDTTNSVLGGWHHYLDLLEDALAGRPVDPDQPEPDYSKRVVPGRPE